MRRDDLGQSVLLGLGLGVGFGLGAVMARMIAQAVKVGAVKTCPACSAQIPAGSRFCPNCGTRLGEGEERDEDIPG